MIFNYHVPKLSATGLPAMKKGMPVGAALRVGDPGQELLKFPAERAPFQVVIRVRDAYLPESLRLERGHWMGKAPGGLECPLLSLSSREKAGLLEDQQTNKD
jgi:hypothetical protein